MFGGPHPYENIPLSVLGYAVGLYLLAAHGLMLLKPEFCQAWLKKLPRHHNAGVYSLAVGMIWFWLLVAPENLTGPLSFLGSLSMDIGEFNAVKGWLRILVPLAYLGMIFYVKEFLFVRGLGVVALMAAGPLLDGAFLRIPENLPFTRLLIPLFAYVLLTKGMFWVGMPYTFRNAVTWATASQARWRKLAMAGLIYGVVVLVCSLSIWKGV